MCIRDSNIEMHPGKGAQLVRSAGVAAQLMAKENGMAQVRLPSGDVYKRQGLRGGVTVSGHNDHRIAMMAAVAATRCAAPVTVRGAECVNKSYPNFWRDFAALGGNIQ